MGVEVREKVKGSNDWYIFINYKSHRKAKHVGKGKEGKRAALVAKEKIQAKLALGDLSLFEPGPKSEPIASVSDFAGRWLKTDVAVRLKPSSQETYEQVIRLHIRPTLGSIPLKALTRDHVKGFLANRTDAGLGPERTQLALNVLTACLNAAVEAGLIPSNPAVRLGRYAKNPNAPIRMVEIFTATELDRVLETAERETPALYPLILLMARTGLRLGEALTVQLGDLDLDRRELWVRRSWGSTGKHVRKDHRIGTPKNKRLRRVDMSQQLCEVLRSSLVLREAEGILAGRPVQPPDWLFPGADGDPMTRNMFQPRWRRLLRLAGVRYRKGHTLRHTYASMLLQNGESPAYVRDQLGHHSIQITVDTYGHLIPGANKTAVDRLDGPTRNPGATKLAHVPHKVHLIR